MFKNILVPLDGSNLAETALPPAASLAETLNSPVTLLHIIEENAPKEVHNDHHLTKPDEARDYLKNVATRVFLSDTKVDTHVHTAEVKDVAGSISQHVSEEFNPDLIIMCSHGSGGIRDVLFGSIAQQVLGGSRVPLLLLQPQTVETRPWKLERIFVPLDSESIHDESLPYAKKLAQAYGAELYLLTVIPTYGTLSGEKAVVSTLLPSTSSAILNIQEETAKEHLKTHLDEFLDEGFIVRAEIARGDPANVIVEIAARVEADLILLSTHRKAGIDAFWARSVAPNVARKTHIPILFVPLNGETHQ